MHWRSSTGYGSYTMLTEGHDPGLVPDQGRVPQPWRVGCPGQEGVPQGKQGVLSRPIGSAGLRERAENLYRELDALHPLRLRAKREMLADCRKHPATKWLQSVPYLGKVRSAVMIGRVQTPHPLSQPNGQFWAYCGLALETRSSAEYSVVNGQVQRKIKPLPIRGLNWNHNHELERSVQEYRHDGRGAQRSVSMEFYLGLLDKGMQNTEMARLTLARKIAAITLKIWKEGGTFNAVHLKLQAA